MSVNYHQGHGQGGSSIPKRPTQQSGQQHSNTNWPVVPPQRLTSISTQDTDTPELLAPLATEDIDNPEAPTPLVMQDTDKPEPLAPLTSQDIDKLEPLVSPTMSDSAQSYDVDKRSSLEEMATTRLDAVRDMDIPQSNTPLVWKKIRVSYTATVNVRRVKKRGGSQKPRISSPVI
jgi:hypothetical protein